MQQGGRRPTGGALFVCPVDWNPRPEPLSQPLTGQKAIGLTNPHSRHPGPQTAGESLGHRPQAVVDSVKSLHVQRLSTAQPAVKAQPMEDTMNDTDRSSMLMDHLAGAVAPRTRRPVRHEPRSRSPDRRPSRHRAHQQHGAGPHGREALRAARTARSLADVPRAVPRPGRMADGARLLPMGARPPPCPRPSHHRHHPADPSGICLPDPRGGPAHDPVHSSTPRSTPRRQGTDTASPRAESRNAREAISLAGDDSQARHVAQVALEEARGAESPSPRSSS